MQEYTNPDEDVPSPIDLREPADAMAWAEAAESARPGRAEFRSAIASEIAKLPDGARVLELGSGPGFLAEVVLSRCSNVVRYTLFDFSQPMLAMSRERLRPYTNTEFTLGDFKQTGWTDSLRAPYSAVVSMQAVHEIRHKRHVPALYQQLRAVLDVDGVLLVADHVPWDDSLRWTSLFMTLAEQQDAFEAAGFRDVRTLLTIERLMLMRGTA